MGDNEQAAAPVTSLHDKISQATEVKPPVAPSANNIWFADVDDLKEKIEPDAKPPADEPGKSTDPQKPGTVEIPDKLKRQSAETATIMWTQLLEAAAAFRINSKFKRRFTDEEINRVNDHNLEDKKLDELHDEQDRVTKSKWDRLMRRRDSKLKNIAFSDDETRRTQESFYHVFKLKNITMPPEWALGANLMFQIIDRAIETEID